jgi:hypothetical protein
VSWDRINGSSIRIGISSRLLCNDRMSKYGTCTPRWIDTWAKRLVTVGDAAGADAIEYILLCLLLSRTSMASVAGSGRWTILLTHFLHRTNHQIRYALAVTAQHPEGNSGHCDDPMGYGIVKVFDAYEPES